MSDSASSTTPDAIATLDPNGGDPQVEIVIGFAQFGKYRFSLSDATGQNFSLLAQGDNDDTRPDNFAIPLTPQALDGRTLRYEVIVAAFESGPGQFFNVSVRITQGGVDILSPPLKDTGSLDNTKRIKREVRFKLP